MIFSMLYGTERSTVGALTLDILLREQLELPSEVTKYPVEDGGPDISDHITQGNEILAISGSISEADSQAIEYGPCSSKLMDTIETLRDMHEAREEITVVTGLGIYEDMAFTSLTIARAVGDKGGAWLDIEAKLIQIHKVELQETDLPPEQAADDDVKGKTGTTGKSGGEGNASKTAGKGAADTAPERSKLGHIKDSGGNYLGKIGL